MLQYVVDKKEILLDMIKSLSRTEYKRVELIIFCKKEIPGLTVTYSANSLIK